MMERHMKSVKCRMELCALNFLVLGIPPKDDALNIDLHVLVSKMRTSRDEMKIRCSKLLAAYYCGDDEAMKMKSKQHINHGVYVSLEKKFLGEPHIRNYLSNLADVLAENGEEKVLHRLQMKKSYIVSSAGKGSVGAKTLLMQRRKRWCVVSCLSSIFRKLLKRSDVEYSPGRVNHGRLGSPDEGEARMKPTDESNSPFMTQTDGSYLCPVKRK